MIDFYYWPTPNGWKVSIMLEETGLPYTLKPVNIGAGDQFKPEFMAISPNARMPAIVDHDTPDGPLPVFESGAILIHLAEKSGRFMPTDPRRAGRNAWSGCSGRSAISARWRANSAISSTTRKACRKAITSTRTNATPASTIAAWACWSAGWTGATIILDDYSIADMISWPWVLIAKPLGQSLDEFPNVSRWRDAIKHAPGGAARRRSWQGPAPHRPAYRGGAENPVRPDRSRSLGGQ